MELGRPTMCRSSWTLLLVRAIHVHFITVLGVQVIQALGQHPQVYLKEAVVWLVEIRQDEAEEADGEDGQHTHRQLERHRLGRNHQNTEKRDESQRLQKQPPKISI